MESENATLKVDKSSEKDSDDESSSKKKRAGRASLRLVESREDREDRRREDEEKSRKDKQPEAKTPLELFKTQPAEIKTASKEEVPNEEEVSENEKPLAIRALAAEEAEAIPDHTAQEAVDDPAVAEDIAAKAMLEEAAITGDVEAAKENVAAKLGATPEEVAAAEQQIEAEVPAVTTEEVEPEEPVEEVMFERAAEREPDETEEDEDTAAKAGSGKASTGTATPPLTGPLSPPGGAGGAGLPPRGPFPPFGPGGPGGPPPIPMLSGNLYHTPITPDSPAIERYDQGNPAVTALIGGIIGYLIGRRRGRIKAEKRLIPIQKKLEKQVEDLHWEIKRKELAVRRIAAEKVRQGGPLVIERVAARAEKSTKPHPSERRVTERRAAPEASQLHGATKAPEHLGHMLVTAEAAGIRRQKQPETVRPSKIEADRYEQIPERLRQRHVETLSRADLLAISEKIVVDGTTLRQIYETHLIGERGLRRLVAEYLRGGEVKKILRHEIVEHEIDFERDPALRDLPAQTAPLGSVSTTVPSKSTLDKLVEQASAGLGDNQSSAAAYYKARAAYEAQEYQEQQNQRRLVDIGVIAAITVLLLVIIVLYLTGH